MTSETRQEMIDWSGRTIYDSADQKVGRVEQLWLDDQNGQPEWVTVNTGLLGTKHSFVPVQGIRNAHGNNLQTPYSKEQIKNAPMIEPENDHIELTQEKRLYAYYGLADHNGQAGTNIPSGTQQRGFQQRGTQQSGIQDTANLRGEKGDTRQARGQSAEARGQKDAMTISEERLRVGTERHESGHAKLRKYIVTEDVRVDVPLRRERARIVHEPITEANRKQAMSGQEISEAEYEVTLHEEVPVVRTETVPVEQVRLTTEDVTQHETISRKVRKERIKAEGDIEPESRGEDRR